MSLKPGDRLPAFSTTTETEESITHEELLGQGPFVIYFYPRDNTPICTRQACSFRDQFAAFRNAEATVYGVSMDSAESHRRFKAQHNLPFTLLTDEDRALHQAFGVMALLRVLSGRETFIFDEDGVLLKRFSSRFGSDVHVKEALDALSTLKPKA